MGRIVAVAGGDLLTTRHKNGLIEKKEVIFEKIKGLDEENELEKAVKGM